MTTCPHCGAPAKRGVWRGDIWFAESLQHEPSPLDQLAAWAEANGHSVRIDKWTNDITRSDFGDYWVYVRETGNGGLVGPGDAHAASIQEAAASLYKQVTQ